MKELIYRQMAIDALGEKPLAWQEGEYELGLQNQWQSDIDAIKAVPPAEKCGKWIPCTERLPDEDLWIGMGVQYSESVLVTVVNHANDDKRVVDMAYTRNGEWQSVTIPEWCEIVAWCPPPEPWKGEE